MLNELGIDEDAPTYSRRWRVLKALEGERLAARAAQEAERLAAEAVKEAERVKQEIADQHDPTQEQDGWADNPRWMGPWRPGRAGPGG